MFERLADLLIDFLGLFQFFTTVAPYEEAVVLTLGRYTRTIRSDDGWRMFLILGPRTGFHLYFPFQVEEVYRENVALEGAFYTKMSLSTKDDEQICLDPLVSYKIKDVRKFILEVEDAEVVLRAAVRGAISEAVMTSTWSEIRSPEWREQLFKQCRRRAFAWGIELVQLDFSDLIKVKTINLIQE